ncbi:TPA: hypothetical protein ACRFDF_003861 [Yersinia enterocolitica]|nr:hypothetical protein [Yersinia enterocolitica]HDL6596080.1 hypothetical protein [Yersinia enterocolitica]HDL6935975.1 hypothetical protein [Yersinia enterocolitica]HDZ9579442.1 hypothetical protein [Yersinia enterocolitica]
MDKMNTSEILLRMEELFHLDVINSDELFELKNLVSNGNIEDAQDYLSEKMKVSGFLFSKNRLKNSFRKSFVSNENSESESEITALQKKLKESENSASILREKVNIFSDEYEKNRNIIKENENDIQKLLEKLNSLMTSHEKITIENNLLKARSQQKKIDEEIPGYVNTVSNKLDADDNFFTEMSRNWSIAGIAITLFAVLAAFCTFSQGTDLILKNENLEWTGLLYIFIRGGLGIGLLSWLAFVCFSNSRNYTHESIRRKDRQHALSFGQLFLQIYGSSATKEDAMLVFKDWNMSGDSAFSKENNYTPPNIIDTFKSLSGSLRKNKEE